MRITIKALPAIAIAICFASFCASAAPVARLTFHSDPDDPIGRGEDVDITYAEQMASTFVTIANWQFDPSALNIVQFLLANHADTAIDLAFLTFNTYPTQVAPGFYSLMTQGGAGQPSYDLQFTFRNNNCGPDPASNFNVHEVQFGHDSLGRPTVIKFRASFAFYCFGMTDGLRGTFTFDASDATTPAAVPLSPVPLIIALALVGGLSAARRQWNGRKRDPVR